MPLVHAPQIPQDHGVNAQPTHPAASWGMLKTAGHQAALVDLGLLPPEEMSKEAWVGAVAAGAARALPWLWRGAKAIGSKLWGAGGKVTGAIAKPIGGAGNKAVQAVGSRLGASPATISKVQGLGQGAAREAVGFGLLSGGLNAATAQPGERGSAFLRGAAGGALGGLAWRGASNVASAGLGKALGAGRAAKLTEAAKPGFFGKLAPGQSRLKSIGSKMLMGGVPLAAGMGASMMMPTFEQRGSPQYQAQRAAHLGGAMMGAYPQHPMGYGYNPNLPMPQYGY